MKKATIANRQLPEVLIHICVWIIVIGFLLLIIRYEYPTPHNLLRYMRDCLGPIVFAIIFYINYYILIERYLLKKKYRLFSVFNLVIISILGLSLHIGIEWANHKEKLNTIEHQISINVVKDYYPPQSPPDKAFPPKPDKRKSLIHWPLLIRDIFLLTAALALATTIRMRQEWSKSEQARQQAERNAIESELKNLRNQLNPHFLLNTLNNIYALTSFNTEKAQQALIELSKLLRYVLYENKNKYVPISQETDFIHNYTELMRIRLSDHIDVQISITVDEKEEILIAPLIFVSLIENAFKHGISATLPSYIHIYLTSNKDGDVECLIKNSNFQKEYANDKSGSGIGLEQVYRRLELLYPNAYEWKKGLDSNKEEYTSHLIIHTRKHMVD